MDKVIRESFETVGAKCESMCDSIEALANRIHTKDEILLQKFGTFSAKMERALSDVHTVLEAFRTLSTVQGEMRTKFSLYQKCGSDLARYNRRLNAK